MSRTDHNLFGVQQERAEIDAAMREFREQWGPFCRELGITLYQMRALDSSVLIALLFLHLNTQIGERLNDYELRLRQLEEPRSEAPRPSGNASTSTHCATPATPDQPKETL
jgi:hypothetical protein